MRCLDAPYRIGWEQVILLFNNNNNSAIPQKYQTYMPCTGLHTYQACLLDATTPIRPSTTYTSSRASTRCDLNFSYLTSTVLKYKIPPPPFAIPHVLPGI